MNSREDKSAINISINEASKLAFYLINKPIGREEIDRYEMAVGIKKVSLTSSEQKVWNLMLNNNLILASVDSGLALRNRNSPIRQRICIMLATLEAHPDYISSFYIEKPHFSEHFQLIVSLLTTPFKAILGILIIKLYK